MPSTQLKQQIAALPRPRAVKQEISELKQVLLARADEAEDEYKVGYDLLQEYKFRDSIPHLTKAVRSIPLPSFFLTLSQALRELPEPAEAERVSLEGLALEGLKPTEAFRDTKIFKAAAHLLAVDSPYGRHRLALSAFAVRNRRANVTFEALQSHPP